MQGYRSQQSAFFGYRKQGQNAKLAAGLTGYKIDILPEIPAEEVMPENENITIEE